MPVPGNAAELVWLSPTADSLVALAQPTRATWDLLRRDPGCVLLLARNLRDERPAFSAFEAALAADDALVMAAELLHEPAFADFSRAGNALVYQVCLKQARLAHFLACRLRTCDPELAWIGGLLAPLGWLAVCAADAPSVASCLEHDDLKTRSSQIQHEHWGMEHTAIARRLAARWRLPAWLAAVCGSLSLPSELAANVGADPALFAVVQLAVGLVERTGGGLGVRVGESPQELLRRVGLSGEVAEAGLNDEADLPTAWTPPAAMPLLPEILRIAIESRQAAERRALAATHERFDALYEALEKQADNQQRRLLELKLRALAELAAGAGHEINNPLAVISGQAQYLIAREEDAAKCKSLQVIIDQARRIHQILVELMQFARPPAPHKISVPVDALVRDVHAALQNTIDDKKVELRCPVPPANLYVHVDAGQVLTALKNVLRNGIEAAGADGWVSLGVEAVAERVRFVIEDSGPGLSPPVREHLFDPFFAGKSAGRGRGLGLPTAWRYVCQNEGSLRFVDQLNGPTRFELELPAVTQPTPPTNGHRNGHLALTWD